MPPKPLQACRECRLNVGSDVTGLCATCDPMHYINRFAKNLEANLKGNEKKLNPENTLVELTLASEAPKAQAQNG